ncbi:MAG: hypothetical protein ACXACY_15350 [Candidatus Hodarchaeales archaeon]|jgi:hypothetical protein
MGNKYNSINEQISRIKSLFTEERLYGNIVEQVKIKDGSKGDPYQYKEDNGKYYYTKKGDSKWKEQTSEKGISAIKTKIFDNSKIPLKTNTDTKDNTETNTDTKDNTETNTDTKDNTETNTDTKDNAETTGGETTGGGGSVDSLPTKGASTIETNPINKSLALGLVSDTYESDKNKINSRKGDSIEYWDVVTTKDGKNAVGDRKSFQEIKIILGDKVSPVIEKGDYKAGRDVGYVLINVYDDDENLKELYVKGDFVPITKGEKRGEIKDINKDVRQDKGAINKNVRECKSHLRRHFKLWKDGSNKATTDKEIIPTTEFCVNTFYNRYENNPSIMNLIDTLKDQGVINIDKVSGGVEREKYDVKSISGKLIGTLKKWKGNQYKFVSESGYTAVFKSGNRLLFKDNFRKQIEKTLNLDTATNEIVVIKTNKDFSGAD